MMLLCHWLISSLYISVYEGELFMQCNFTSKSNYSTWNISSSYISVTRDGDFRYNLFIIIRSYQEQCREQSRENAESRAEQRESRAERERERESERNWKESDPTQPLLSTEVRSLYAKFHATKWVWAANYFLNMQVKGSVTNHKFQVFVIRRT